MKTITSQREADQAMDEAEAIEADMAAEDDPELKMAHQAYLNIMDMYLARWFAYSRAHADLKGT